MSIIKVQVSVFFRGNTSLLSSFIVKQKNNGGFTLIEILISTAILAIGLLGFAAMQMTGLQNNLSAYHRSQATQFSYDMADRMRANIADAQNYETSTYYAGTATQQISCTTISGGCSTVQMAQNDLYEWGGAITNSNILPSGQWTIGVIEPIYTITIKWDEDRDGDVDGDDPSFQMSFLL